MSETNPAGIVTINTLITVESEIQETGKEDIPSPTLVRKKTGPLLPQCDFEDCGFAAIDVCSYSVWIKRDGCGRMFCIRHNGKGSSNHCIGGLCEDCAFHAQAAYIIAVLLVSAIIIAIISLPFAFLYIL